MTNAACYLALPRPLARSLRKYSAATFIRVTFLMGTAPVLVFAAIPVARMNFARVTPVAWLCLAAVIVFASVLAYVLNAWPSRAPMPRGSPSSSRFSRWSPRPSPSSGSGRCRRSRPAFPPP
jgi:hypothetical protein